MLRLKTGCLIRRLACVTLSRSSSSTNNFPYIIMGLGNPSPTYDGTRHSVGKDCIDFLTEQYELQYQTVRDLNADFLQLLLM
jgi:hypothetical protein